VRTIESAWALKQCCVKHARTGHSVASDHKVPRVYGNTGYTRCTASQPSNPLVSVRTPRRNNSIFARRSEDTRVLHSIILNEAIARVFNDMHQPHVTSAAVQEEFQLPRRSECIPTTKRSATSNAIAKATTPPSPGRRHRSVDASHKKRCLRCRRHAQRCLRRARPGRALGSRRRRVCIVPRDGEVHADGFVEHALKVTAEGGDSVASERERVQDGLLDLLGLQCARRERHGARRLWREAAAARRQDSLLRAEQSGRATLGAAAGRCYCQSSLARSRCVFYRERA
jgi:hypothetical protein